MTGFRTLENLAETGLLKGGEILVRVDFNVPLKDGVITDATRIERALPTIQTLIEAGSKTILLSHFGRPKGKRTAEMSLKPVAEALSRHLRRPVGFAEDCVGAPAEQAIAAMKPGDVLLLENTRFHAGEEANDPAFAARLADLGQAFVADAFSCAHRAHASTEGLAHHLPAVAGRAMEAELEALTAALEAPQRPVAAIVGGAKISTKLSVLKNLVAKVDLLVIGGGMANTFLAAQGVDVGKSLCERDLLATAREIMQAAAAAGCEIVLPSDAVLATGLEPGIDTRTAQVGEVEPNEMILDIGPEAIAALNGKLAGCRTVLWNGPLGAFEVPPFDAGTVAVARQVAALSEDGTLVSVAGGGDTVAALAQAGVEEAFSYVSTAGGAFLEWLEGKDLPGVAVLKSG